MYAIIESGGKQYRVAEKDTLTVEKLNAKPGETVDLEKVLLIADGDTLTFGKPTVEGAKVTAKVLSQDKANKIKVFKFKRRKGYRRKQGHRQQITRLSVEKIHAA
jgi:large subunit ribosomal protein L21